MPTRYEQARERPGRNDHLDFTSGQYEVTRQADTHVTLAHGDMLPFQGRSIYY